MATSNGTQAPVDRIEIGRDVWRIAIVTVLGTIMSVLDSTIVNIALERLSHDFKTSLDSIQWVVTGYLLSLAAVIPISGWAARRFGARPLYVASIVIFTVGSALCGLATSLPELVAFRVLQGIGGGMIIPLGQLIMVKKAGPERLPRVMSAIGVPVILGPVIGPTIGGLLLDYASWRWIFYVNVPIGVIAVIAALRVLPREPKEDAGHLDLVGLFVAAFGLVAITYGLAEIGTTNKIVDIRVLGPGFAGIALVALFVLRALRVEKPLLDVRLYTNRAFSAASLTTFSLGAALFGGMILMPLYFQVVRELSPVHAGLLLAPTGVGVASSTWFAGRFVERIGAGWTAFIGGTLSVIFTLPFVLLTGHTSYLLICCALCLRGFAIGLTNVPAMTAAYRALRPEKVADATPQLNVLQRLGSSIGVAITAVVLQRGLGHAGSSVSRQATAFDHTFWWVISMTAVATLPTIVLIRIERRLAGAGPMSTMARVAAARRSDETTEPFFLDAL